MEHVDISLIIVILNFSNSVSPRVFLLFFVQFCELDESAEWVYIPFQALSQILVSAGIRDTNVILFFEEFFISFMKFFVVGSISCVWQRGEESFQFTNTWVNYAWM